MIKNAGVWTATVIFLFGAFFFWLSRSYKYTVPTGPGPGFLPLWLSGILMVLAVLYLLESLRNVVSIKDILPDRAGRINILRILFAFVLFFYLVGYTGFVLAGTVFLLILLAKEYKWYTSLAISLGCSLFLFVVFVQLLGVPLPVNEWGW